MSAMMEGPTLLPDIKTRKRAAAKAAGNKNRETVKSTIILSVEAAQRLGIHATMAGEDRSAIVDRLIREHLKGWKVSTWGKSSGQDDSTSAT